MVGGVAPTLCGEISMLVQMGLIQFADAKEPPNSLITKMATNNEINGNFNFNSFPIRQFDFVVLNTFDNTSLLSGIEFFDRRENSIVCKQLVTCYSWLLVAVAL